MSCVRCTSLLRTFRAAQSSYQAARTSAFFVVTQQLAASKQVDMERAKSELFEHQKICRPPGYPARDGKLKLAS